MVGKLKGVRLLSVQDSVPRHHVAFTWLPCETVANTSTRMVIMCLFTGVLILAMWIPSKTNAPIIVFAALFGFGSGAFVSLLPSMIAQISDVRKIGVRTGTIFAIISIAALISNPIGGAIITRWNGSYTGLQIYSGIMCTSGALIILASRVVLAGPKLTTKV